MGAQESILKDVEMGESVDRSSHLFMTWTDICPSRYMNSITSATFVRIFAETDSEETRGFFENGIRTLRQLRHPAIVNYISSSVLSGEACLVCERVLPLDVVLDSLEPVEVLSGLHNIMDALVFLHDTAHMYHNNVCPDAIFVCGNGEFKLGSLECAQKADNNRHWVLSDFAKTIKQPAFLPPEDQSLIKSDAPGHARDSYGFGKLIEFLIPYIKEFLPDALSNNIENVMQSLTHENAKMRPEIGTFVKSNVFKNDITDISRFLTCLPLHSLQDKHIFFRSLVTRLGGISLNVSARRLVKPMLSRYTLLEEDAAQYLLPYLLKPSLQAEDGGIYNAELFCKYVLPELCRIFCVHEKAVRLAVLSHFDSYVRYFTEKTLREHILPELLLGMKDVDNDIVSESLRCLSLVVPILGGPTVTGLNHAKYFSDGTPKPCQPYKESQNLTYPISNLPPSSLIETKIESPEKDIPNLSENSESKIHGEVKFRLSDNEFALETDAIGGEDEAWVGWEDEGATPDPPSHPPKEGITPDSHPPIDNTLAAPIRVSQKCSKQKSDQPKMTPKNIDLGAEFEIQAIEKTIETEPDFFADMQPELIAKKNNKKPDKKKKPSNIFQMVTNEVDVDTWAADEDTEWTARED